ncbi:GntR family transcriptional regulator [Kineosporia sp. J2-2]|uniref:GntR family transcriptional regulator n=1 Tax=Kineosporia corallincola TaxID=2835133 RepID=A0ABS5TEQ6_9ACTN|nr:GntR family transcriptional regulator [Kineosporia corallincola]MBT0768701.1 GntR family transcriptional regulator [Kineosporia corallincola]
MSRTTEETASLAHYNTLRQRILAGEITPDMRLYESSLTTELGTSRTPIREALAMLERDGILKRERRGYRVHERTPQEVLDYFDVRNALESASAEAAALRATELERAEMVVMLKAAAAEQDPERRARIHNEWHRALLRASHNPALAEFVDRAEVLISLKRKPWQDSVAGSGQSQDEHQAVLDAVLARDPELARRLMAAHMSRARDHQLTLLTAR